MATWPATLPPPALSTLQEAPPNNTIRTQMDKGPAKIRRRTTANIRPIAFSLKLTKAQVQTLDDFYNITTYSGADEFDFIHPRTDQPCTARFVQPPGYNEQEGMVYNASVSLEIMP